MGWLGFGSVGLVRAQGRKARRKGAQGGVVLRGWVQWYEIRGAWGRTGKQFRRKYPFGLQKLEAKSFRFHQVEGIYTEKMITLSNVSQEGW